MTYLTPAEVGDKLKKPERKVMTTEELLARATRFSIGVTKDHRRIAVEKRGSFRWAICDGPWVWNKEDGEWIYELTRSEITDDFIALTRYDSRDQAIAAAEKVVKEVVLTLAADDPRNNLAKLQAFGLGAGNV